ncbi:MAG TPA: DUF2252 domain-containing protein [Candidatus Acidoferrum sp.]|nr:DUF2252 domain-containing protein [Candidatus Acidoferrum sp.]
MARSSIHKKKRAPIKVALGASAPIEKLGPPREARMAAGKALREKVPRTSHAKWTPPDTRPDPITILKSTDKGRVPELLPIRYGRMSQSPFGFLRGSAAVMARDLAGTPTTGIRVQACGDCHVSNFGGFGTPERELFFDINDFDETLPAPWEWDVKRLAASIVVARRVAGTRERQCADSARSAVESYRTHIREFAAMRALDVWFMHIGADVLMRMATARSSKKRWRQLEEKARRGTASHFLPKFTELFRGERRICDHPPLVYHSRNSAEIEEYVRETARRYRQTLSPERRVILDRYKIVDVARKVVGVGSVGTRCSVVLMMADNDDPLFLQVKEATASVLEPYAGKSRFSNHGERVVVGQRMLQSASDPFLGWTDHPDGNDFYFRQLRDMKMAIDPLQLSKDDWREYPVICGWALARAHARTGDAAKIAGYLGKNEVFDDAITRFSCAYADQTERDHSKLLKAIRAGRIRAARL